MLNLRYIDYGTLVAGMGLDKGENYYMQQILDTYVMRHSLILSHSSKQYHDISVTSPPAATWQHRISRLQYKLLPLRR